MTEIASLEMVAGIIIKEYEITNSIAFSYQKMTTSDKNTQNTDFQSVLINSVTAKD